MASPFPKATATPLEKPTTTPLTPLPPQAPKTRTSNFSYSRPKSLLRSPSTLSLSSPSPTNLSFFRDSSLPAPPTSTPPSPPLERYKGLIDPDGPISRRPSPPSLAAVSHALTEREYAREMAKLEMRRVRHAQESIRNYEEQLGDAEGRLRAKLCYRLREERRKLESAGRSAEVWKGREEEGGDGGVVSRVE